MATATTTAKKPAGSLASAENIARMMAQSATEAAERLGEHGERMALDRIEAPEEQLLLSEFERRKRARGMSIPTDDVVVKLKLRMLNQPICLFGEDILDRRERLRALLSTMDPDEVAIILHSDASQTTVAKRKREEEIKETWYHRGGEELRLARLKIADFSLREAKKRLENARADAEKPAHERAILKQDTHKWIQALDLHASQVADLRPVSYAEISPDSKRVATAGWTGRIAAWGIPDCKQETLFAGHSGQAGCVRWHPDSENSALNLASCSHDGTVKLWSLNQTEPVGELEKAETRVSRIAFHPMGRHLASCVFDATWRFYDVETGVELYSQEGHAKAVFDIAFQRDGSLALTGGHDCYGRVWDIRTGRCVMFCDGHTKEICTVTWLRNGYEFLTGGADHSAKVWDVRSRRVLYTLAAHTSLVSKIAVQEEGEYAVTSSYDNTLKIWSSHGWQPLRTLNGHEMKVTCVDVSQDSRWIVSTSFDRTFKLWSSQDMTIS